jgi:hypothetical protein
MTDTTRPAQQARRAWVAPSVQRLRAGDAEQFTRPTTLDAGFTKS